MISTMRKVSSLLALFGLGAAIISFLVNPGVGSAYVVWGLRAFFILLTISSLGACIWAYKQKERAKNYLKEMFGKKRFDCDGVGLALDIEERDGVACLAVYFQNRYEHTGRSIVTLKQIRALTGGSSLLGEALIECPGGAFGVQYVPIGVPEKKQGKKLTIDVSAKSGFASGKGSELVFNPGQPVGESGKAAGNPLLLATAMLAGGILAVAMVQGKGRRIKLRYPMNVEPVIDPDTPTHTELLWERGDEDEDGDSFNGGGEEHNASLQSDDENQFRAAA